MVMNVNPEDQLRDQLKEICQRPNFQAIPNEYREAIAFSCLSMPWLLDGKLFQVGERPEWILMGPPKKCFENAEAEAMAHDLNYCEGVALAQHTTTPIRHGWICYEGMAIDNTWEEIGLLYFGIEIEDEELEEFFAKWHGESK